MADLTKVREIELLDADAFLALRTQLDRETENMMLEPGERDQDRVAHARFVHGMANSKTHAIFVAEAAADILTGYIELECGAFRRNRHATVFVIGVLEAFQGMGIGTRLFAAAEAWARRQGIVRLELTARTDNHAGQALYKKMGFEIEGTRKRSLCVNGAYVDEFAMAKIIAY